MHEGHRQRIIEKLGSPDSLQDHELLEILLFNAIPRKNTNEIGHMLLDKFGTLSGVLGASVDQLKEIEGIGASTAAYLRIVGLFCERTGNQFERVCASDYASFLPYLQKKHRSRKEEVTEIYCLDKKDEIVGIETYTTGHEDATTLPSGALSQLFFLYKPVSIVVVHNHPKGPAAPSSDDDTATAKIFLECVLNGVRLYDHIIVASGSEYSYRMDGRISELRDSLDIDRLLRRNGIKRVQDT